MNKLNCFVIDDEQHARELLKHYIDLDDRLNFIGSYHNAINSSLENYPVDILFLDIEMPGIKGIDFLESITPNFKTIFTTAHKEYAFHGYELGVSDYLLKPILNKRFTKAIDTVVSAFNNEKKLRELDQLQKQEVAVILKSGSKEVKVIPEQIKYISAQNEYISISTKNQRITIYMRMKDIEDNPSFNHLLRVHRSFIINPSFIDERHSEYLIIDDDMIPIGRSFKKAVKAKLNQFQQERY